MKRFMLLLCMVGCVPPTPGPKPDKPDIPDVVKPNKNLATESEYWHAIADRIDAGRIADVNELIGIVKASKADGDILDTGKLATAIPSAENRKLTAADAAAIRSIK